MSATHPIPPGTLLMDDDRPRSLGDPPPHIRPSCTMLALPEAPCYRNYGSRNSEGLSGTVQPKQKLKKSCLKYVQRVDVANSVSSTLPTTWDNCCRLLAAHLNMQLHIINSSLHFNQESESLGDQPKKRNLSFLTNRSRPVSSKRPSICLPVALRDYLLFGYHHPADEQTRFDSTCP